MFKSVVFIIAVIGLSGCGSDGDGSAVACTKAVNSSWQAQEVNFGLDLSGATIGFTKDYRMTFSNGASCDIEGKITGTTCAGNIKVNTSTWDGGGPSDPGCADLIGTDNYTVSGATMVICESETPTDCLTYK